MGEPVKIADLARQMIELSGKIAGVDIEIEFTGLKRGEKITEELADVGEDTRPSVPGVLEVVGEESGRKPDSAQLQMLIAAARHGHGRDVVELVASMVRDIRSNGHYTAKPEENATNV